MNKKKTILGIKDTYNDKRYIITDMEGDILDSLILLEESKCGDGLCAHHIPRVYSYPENTFKKNKNIYGYEWIIMKVAIEVPSKRSESELNFGIIENIQNLYFREEVGYGIAYANTIVSILLSKGELEKAFEIRNNVLENQLYYKMGRGDVSSYLKLLENTEFHSIDIHYGTNKYYLFPLTLKNIYVYPYLIKRGIEVDYSFIKQEGDFGTNSDYMDYQYTKDFSYSDLVRFHKETGLNLMYDDPRLCSKELIVEASKQNYPDFILDFLLNIKVKPYELVGQIDGDNLLTRMLPRFEYFIKDFDESTLVSKILYDYDTTDYLKGITAMEESFLEFIFPLITYKSYPLLMDKFDATKIKDLIIKMSS